MDLRRSAGLILLISLLAFGGSAAGRPKYVPTFLLRDTFLGVTFWGPAGFVPNPDKAATEGARMHWYGTAPGFDRWGFYTYYRAGPIADLEPAYFAEELERKWGPPAAEPRPLALPGGAGLLTEFHRTEKGVKWAIVSVLIPAVDGVFDLTVFAPCTDRRRLARFTAAFAASVRVHAPTAARPFTLPAGISFALDARWEPEPVAPAGTLFRAYRFQRRYRIDLAIAPENVVESEKYIRATLHEGPGRTVTVESSEVPAGRLLMARHPDRKGGLLAVLDAKDLRLVLDAVMPAKAGAERLVAVARTVTLAPGPETESRMLEVAQSLRLEARRSGPGLRQALDALTPFTGHPEARAALLPLLAGRREDVVVEAGLRVAAMAPFGPSADELRGPLARALKRRHYRAAAVLALALGQTGHPSVVADLKPLMHGKNLGVACAAADGLGHVHFGNGEAAEALVDVFETLTRAARGSRASYRGRADVNARKLTLEVPVREALRRQSGRDFPRPDGPRAARKWLEERRRARVRG